MRLAALIYLLLSLPFDLECQAATGSVGIIDSVPLARFETAGDPLYQVAGGVLAGDSAVLAERSTGMIHFFGSDGQPARTTGRLGEGPGEFRLLLWIQSVNGTLYAGDATLRRVSRFTRSGTFERSLSIRIPGNYSILVPVGVFDDGSVLVEARRFPVPHRKPETRRDVATLFRVNSKGDADSVGTYKLSERYAEPFGKAGELTTSATFGRQSGAVVASSSFYVVQNDSAVIERHTMDGELQSVLRPATASSFQNVRVTAADIRVARRRFIEKGNSPGLFERIPVPETFPAFGWAGSHPLALVRAHSDGTIWVVHFGGVRDSQPMWTVFNVADGSQREVSAPSEMDVLDSAANRVLILRYNEDDEEIVETRRIRWNPTR